MWFLSCASGQTKKQTNKHTNRETDRQTHRYADRNNSHSTPILAKN